MIAGHSRHASHAGRTPSARGPKVRGIAVLPWLQLLALALFSVLFSGTSPEGVSAPPRVAMDAVELIRALREPPGPRPQIWRDAAGHSVDGRDAVEDVLEGDDIEDDRDDDRESLSAIADASALALRGLRSPRAPGRGLRDAPQTDTSCSSTSAGLPRGPPA